MERLKILEIDIDEDKFIEKGEKEKFKITDLKTCNWAFKKLAAIKIKEDGIEELAKNEIEKITKWKEDELKKTENEKAFFEGLLTEYYMNQKEVEPRFKLSTPYGKVTSRKQQPKYEYKVDKFIEWAEKNGYSNLIRIKKEVDQVETKNAFIINGNKLIDENTGEIVDGVTVTPKADSITVKVE